MMSGLPMTKRTIRGVSRPVPLQGTKEIRVILYAKDDPFCATALADEFPIEDILTAERSPAR